MDRSACLYLTNNGGFAGVFTCVGEQCYDYRLSLNHCNTFLTHNEVAAKRTYMEVSKCDVTVQLIYCFTPHLYPLSSAVTSSMRCTDMHHTDYPETCICATVRTFICIHCLVATTSIIGYLLYLLFVGAELQTSTHMHIATDKCMCLATTNKLWSVYTDNNYASVGGAPRPTEAYGSRRVFVCLCFRRKLSRARSPRPLKIKRLNLQRKLNTILS